MKKQQLHTVAKIIAGQSPPSSTYNSTGDGLPFFQGKADFQEKYPRVRMWCNSISAKEAKPGDILMSVRAPVGSVNICDQKSIIGRGLAAIRVSPAVDADFLYFFLKSNEQAIAKLGTGSTFKAITQDTLKKVEIPLPPLDDQKRIAHLLSKVEGLIAQRKQHLQQLDDLLKSVFLEMFGDPVRNEKGWEKVPVTALSKKITDGEHLNPEFTVSGMPMIMAGNVLESTVDLSDAKRVDAEIGKRFRRKCDPERDDILLVSRGATIGRLCRVDTDVPFCLMGSVILIKPDREMIVPAFLAGQLKHERMYSKLFRSSGSSAQQAIYLKDVKRVVCIRPPMPLQNQFAAIVEKVEAIKFHYQQSLTILENLYGALSQKAFKGELDLSRVPLVEPITGTFNAQLGAITMTATGDVGAPPPAIDLPDVEGMLQALTTDDGRKRILKTWLESYATQHKGSAFSVNDFLRAAQVRIAELHPDNDFEIGLAEYDQLKDCVFAALRSGKLAQIYDDPGNRVQLKAAKS